MGEQRAPREAIKWIPVSELPPTRRPLLFTGDSGYIKPHDRFVVAGYYDPQFRPLSPFQDCTSTSLSESGFEPTHWAYLDPEMLPQEEE